MPTTQLYDTIGAGYPATRRTDPRIARPIWTALGDARTVVNVGAGTGSYEPADRAVVAVEPSALMRSNRPAGAAPCVGATAERLPFADGAFDAAMAVCTLHHWSDPEAGLRELRRVARRVVVFAFDTREADHFWLTRDYLPELHDLPGVRTLDRLTDLAADVLDAEVRPVPVPGDCADGLYEAYWRRPEAYLDARVRRAISVWGAVGPDVEQRAVERLRADLDSGAWHERNGHLLELDELDLGARLLVA
ncbi:hypothetical protein GCM10023340_10390 [Nocardioides marinquilinus]|uniref:Methyltransferase type 11 domain-containing protein n=1 Tax=Nocardioides marinquilinus TaxID=1210400 RepID=A0ABP9PEN2_9ACTN